MQEFEHNLAGIKFGEEYIAENKDLEFDDKQIIENTEENIETLKARVGENRVVEFEKAKGRDEKEALRTPGNWVVLRGKKWGKLDDYIIPASVYSALDDFNRNEPFIKSRTLRTINRFWKKNMTVYSLQATVNNVASSFLLSYYHDIPPANVKKALRIIYNTKYRTNSASAEDVAILDEASRMGALFGTLNISEDLAGIMEEQVKAMENTQNSRGGHFDMAMALASPFTEFMRNGWQKAKNIDQLASDFYANQDNVFRLAAYMTYVEQMAVNKSGELTVADLESAGKKAADSMINYDINAKYINIMRQSFWPFLAWPYRALPMMAKIAVEKPWKIFNTLAAIAVLDGLAYALMKGADDDREEWERGLLPEYMRQSVWGVRAAPAFVRVPVGDDPNKGTFLGLGRMVPLGDVLQVNEGAVLPQTLMPGGPLIVAAQALFNYDAFRQDKLRDEAKTFGENVSGTAEFIWRGTMPATLTKGMDWWDKVVSDKRGPLGSEANAIVETARVLGFNFREVDFAEAGYNQSQADKNLRQKIKTNMRKAVKAELRYGVPDLDAIEQVYADYYGLLDESYAKREE
jgi:hypothetical protein